MIELHIVNNETTAQSLHKSASRIRRVAIALLALGAIAIVLLLSGFAVESLRMRRLAAQAPPGAFYRVNGYRMHMVCTGAGSPTLLLEAGIGDDFLSWRRVQPELSKVTRVCSYDRAGYGWSDARKEARDTGHVVAELHDLVEQAGIGGPIVLMGHSAGGLFIRKYATLYPQGIVGMIFVDASTPTQVERMPKEFPMVEDFTWDKLLLPFGITRLRGHCGVDDATTPEMKSELEFHDCRREIFDLTDQEEIDFNDSCREARDTGPFDGIPVLIFSQDPELHFGISEFPLEVTQRGAATWNTLQEELKRLSPRSRRIIARGSTHYIQVIRPDLVIREVSHTVREIRGDEPPRGDYGSTGTE